VKGLAVFLTALLCLSSAALADSITHDGRERTYILEVPSGLSLPAPTVFVLHGGSRSAEKIRRSTRFNEQGERSGYVTVYPDGVGNQWNDAREAFTIRSNQGGEDIDDVGFLSALARKLAAEGVADPARTYVTGSSNGGMMSFRLACEAADVFAAFAPVIASLPARAEATCRPARPVPLLMMNGTEDLLIPWGGGQVAPMFPGDRGTVLSVPRTVEIFLDLNGCREAENIEDRSLDQFGISLSIDFHTGCNGFGEVMFYRFEGMGHRWPETAFPNLPGRLGDILGPAPRNFPAARHIWDFFRRYRLPG